MPIPVDAEVQTVQQDFSARREARETAAPQNPAAGQSSVTMISFPWSKVMDRIMPAVYFVSFT